MSARIGPVPRGLACILLLILMLVLPCADARSDEDPAAAFARAVREVRRDIDEAKDHLVSRRKEIAEERIALSRQVQQLTDHVQEMRETWRRRVRERDGENARLETLERRAGTLEGRFAVTRSLLVEIRRNAEVQLDLVDAAARAVLLAEIDALLDEEAGDAGMVAAAGKLLGLLADHAEAASRLRKTTGCAIGPDGREIDGTFVQIGDVLALFAGEKPGSPSGIVRLVHGSPRPHMWTDLPAGACAGITDLIAGREATVPIDVTSGAALRTREARRSLGQLIEAGGVVMYPIIVIALLGLLVGVFKLVQLLRIRTDFNAPLAGTIALLRNGETAEAAGLAKRTPRPLGRLMEAAVARRDASRADLEEVLNETILVEVPPLERYLTVLSVGAAVSPLLGLLGTVTGMIHTFRLISVFGTGDPRMLSGGISEALITTEAGLVVAIPLVLLYAVLSRRVHAISEGLEVGAIGLLNGLKGGGDAKAGDVPREHVP